MNQLSFLKRQLTEIQRFLKVGYWEYRLRDAEMGWSEELYRLFRLRYNSVRPSFDEFFKHIHPDDVKIVHNAYKRAEKESTEVEVFHRLRTVGEREIHVKQMIKVEKDSKGEDEIIVGVICDITDKIFYEKSKSELQESYMLTAKLASLGRIANAIAHKINNPLMVLSGNVQLLGKHIDDCAQHDPKVDRYIDTIFESLERITGITSGLRSYADAGIDGDEIFDINTIIEKTNHFAGLIKLAPDVKITVSLAPEELVIYGNVGKFQQVILNIFTNAVDALAGKRDKVISISSFRQDDMVCIEFVDNGHGIEADKVHRVFDSFYTTRERDTGIGVGLSIARNIVESHKGTIELSSTVGEGTSALIRLPSYN